MARMEKWMMIMMMNFSNSIESEFSNFFSFVRYLNDLNLAVLKPGISLKVCHQFSITVSLK